MEGFRIPLGDWVESIVSWVTATFGIVFDVIEMVGVTVYDSVAFVLSAPPFWAIIVIVALLGLLARGWVFALGSAAALFLVASVDLWEEAMDTVALVLVSSVTAVIIAIPLGILAAKSDTVSNILKPILDFLQTMPILVYLVPALLLFGVGAVTGMVATVLFATAPGVRLTELGIRGVDNEVVEAGQAFGASPGRILRQIQLPLALPSIMTGVNQVIMLSLSMVVIASMVGAPGLGQPVVAALNRIDVGLGFEAGISVVVIAIILDRLFASFGRKRKPRRSKAVTDPAVAGPTNTPVTGGGSTQADEGAVGASKPEHGPAGRGAPLGVRSVPAGGSPSSP